MSSERYVVLGLAHVRSPWFREVSRWATAAAVPLDFVKCVSVDELRARLGSGRAFSAVLADAGLPGIDRDLVEEAREHGTAVILVDDGAQRDLAALGISALLPAGFDRGALIATLDGHTSTVGTGPVESGPGVARPAAPGGWRGHLVAVTGAGGSGTSTIAMAVAQGLATDVRTQGRVLLADLALDADQAMLHDARDIVPGVQELAEAFRHGNPTAGDIASLTFGDGHPYRVLLGLRRHRDWSALRPRAWQAALDGLRRTFTQVVADIDPDLEGEPATGSLDIEDRNLLARSVASSADVVLVTAAPGVQGVHRLVRILAELVEHGVAAERIQPVIVRAPRPGRARAELSRAVTTLLAPVLGPFGDGLAGPVFIAEHRRLDQAVRDGTGLPASLCRPLASAVLALEGRAAAVVAPGDHTRGHPSRWRSHPDRSGAWAATEEGLG